MKIELANRAAAPPRRECADRDGGCGTRTAIPAVLARRWQNVLRSRTRWSVKCPPCSPRSRARLPTRARASLPAHRSPRRSEPSKAREIPRNQRPESERTGSVVFAFAHDLGESADIRMPKLMSAQAAIFLERRRYCPAASDRAGGANL